MELLLFAYLWDNAWFCRVVDYPDRPSKVTLAFATFLLVNSTYQLVSYEPGTIAESAYLCLLVISGLAVVVLGRKQTQIESKKMFDPSLNIDEIKLRINHFFKRKEALFSTVGKSVLFLGVARSLVSTYLFCVSPHSKFRLFVFADLLSFSYLVSMFVGAIMVK